jgi:hypothetical protein
MLPQRIYRFQWKMTLASLLLRRTISLRFARNGTQKGLRRDQTHLRPIRFLLHRLTR